MILVHGTPYCLIRANLLCGQMCILVSLDWIFEHSSFKDLSKNAANPLVGQLQGDM
jgi:hypothetical protein